MALTLIWPDGRARDIAVRWQGTATVDQLLHAAGIAATPPVRVVAAGMPLPGDLRLDDADLRYGDVLHLRYGTDREGTTGSVTRPPAHLSLAISGGPCAGAMFPLPPGSHLLGRSLACDITIEDGEISRDHLKVSVTDSSVMVEDLGSRNGTYLEGQLLAGPAPLRPGQLVEVGRSRLELISGPAPQVKLNPAGNGCLLVRRPPRISGREAPAEIMLPTEPAEPPKRTIPVFAMVIPVIVGGALWAFTRSLTTLVFVAMSPLMMIGNLISDHRSGRRRYRRDRDSYQHRLAEAEQRVSEELSSEGRRRRNRFPDPAAILAIATGQQHRLWERRRGAADFLEVRVGLAEQDSDVRIRPEESPRRIADVPCTVSLSSLGVLGVAGPADIVRRVGWWLTGQSAVSSGPSDLRIVLLAEHGAEGEWWWARWVPHLLPDSGWPGVGLATTPDTVRARVRELVDLIERRRRAVSDRRSGAPGNWPWVLVVLGSAHEQRAVPGMDVVLGQGPEVGVVAVCLETTRQRLPVECRAAVTVREDGRASLHVDDAQPVDDVLLDGVSPQWAETLSHALAPLRDPEGEADSGVVPDSVRLLDLLGADVTSAEQVAAGWRCSPRSTSAAIGSGADGPVYLDLRRDGPHGLVAGTTGSGKSEFLQTLVASLAVANRPDALTFLLIDYKGGSAFKDCVRLPHTVGMVTDLDAHLVRRALVSLSAELTRRERILAEAGAKDIEDYTALVDRGDASKPMPRLLIVIDEFAAMARELPDFVTGLVSIAQRGRSLGIHLILATQSPSGVVSADIRANTNLRIAFRVTAALESAEVIEVPDAVMISEAMPGRAYLRTGYSSLRLFQSARVGGSNARSAGTGEPVVTIATVPWAETRQAAKQQVAADNPADTDLSALVAGVAAAADALGISKVPSPWLAPLPEVLPLARLERRSGGAPFALVDLPAGQAQQVLRLDLEHTRHLLVAGAPRTGRTTFLRTLAASLASRNDVDDLWLYVIDCGSGELAALDRLPHTGAVVTRAEAYRVDRLLSRLRAEVVRRLDLLAVSGCASLAEYRAARPGEERLPYLVLLLDRWEGFLEEFDDIDAGRLTRSVMELAGRGAAAGLRLVLTGDRSLLKLGTVAGERLCLAMADRADFTLAGLNLREVPTHLPPGRAVRSSDGAELQLALLGTDPSGASQNVALDEIASQARRRPPARRNPFSIALLDDTITTERARALPGWQPGSLRAMAGVGGDELASVWIDLRVNQPGFTIVGPRRSGRSTALLAVAESLLAGGTPVLALCPRSSPLRDLAQRPGVLGVFTGTGEAAGQPLVDAINGVDGPLGVLVDDAPMLHATVVGDVLDQEVREGPERGHALVIAGVADDLLRPVRGFIPETRQSRAGLLLCPESHLHGEVIGIRLPRGAAFSRPPGRGILVLDNQSALVQVPIPGTAAAQ